MSTTKSPSANGRKRPQLTDSINRLDSILDGLSEAIPATVADSIQENLQAAIKEAVQAALAEILTSPEMLANFTANQPQSSPPVPAKPSPKRTWSTWLRSGWKRVTTWAESHLHPVQSWCAEHCERTAGTLSSVWAARGSIGLSLLLGGSLGLLAYLSGPMLSSLLSGLLASALTTLALLLSGRQA